MVTTLHVLDYKLATPSAFQMTFPLTDGYVFVNSHFMYHTCTIFENALTTNCICTCTACR